MIPLGVLASAHVAPAGGGGTAVADSFDRANSTSTLGNADTGQTWEVPTGTAGIESNTARAYANLTDAVIDYGQRDMRVEATCTTNGALYLRLFARYEDSNNHFAIFNVGNASARPYCIHGGTESALAPPFSMSSGDTLTLECYDDGSDVIVNVLVNDTPVWSNITVSYVDNPAGTRGGMRLGATSQTARWDDFSIGAPE